LNRQSGCNARADLGVFAVDPASQHLVLTANRSEHAATIKLASRLTDEVSKCPTESSTIRTALISAGTAARLNTKSTYETRGQRGNSHGGIANAVLVEPTPSVVIDDSAAAAAGYVATFVTTNGPPLAVNDIVKLKRGNPGQTKSTAAALNSNPVLALAGSADHWTAGHASSSKTSLANR
jgi:hypothetical protein